jgi:tetratricopeptide (TPR) repeat protein
MNIFERLRGNVSTPIPQDFLGITDDQLTELYRSAASYLDQDDPNNAVRAFTLLCHLHPFIPEFWSGLGESLFELQIFEEALSAFLMAETLDSHRFEFYEQGIRCALAMDDEKEAQHIFDRLMAHRNKIDDFSSNRSKMLELKKELSKKIKSFIL